MLLGDLNFSKLILGKNHVFSNETIIKIVLILLDSPPSQCTDIKTCFLVLWFNCELKIETGNEKHKTKYPTNS